ncbi:hypothetical protein ASD16_11745 [Cellulomonas sp. Root485]|uniref:class I SAM-dependent methyltransferase n=1 Tax=Cellulomonas sp. Root485 TaxID=1736546 RepID=UPI0007007069|nr:class I SAM-dependent methyltransferase [Cellulomonas sp. Root485]KQY23226.1 hypothetical protein ASD16_11745 [Cellulomonas sp. Root485]
MGEFRDRVKSSRIAPAAALPGRARLAGQHSARVLRQSAQWLVTSREHENFTYDLTDVNLSHLAWFIADVAEVPVDEAEGYLQEIQDDAALRGALEARARAGTQPGLADRKVMYGRRVGWYALVRATKPSHVVETGTDKGLGACVLAAALLRNGSGRLTTIDIDAAAGHLIAAPYDTVTDLRIDDSIAAIGKLETVDLFLHDSDHSPGHERREFEAVSAKLSDSALVLSDNSHSTTELQDWARRTGRSYSFFDERPKDHWYPGGGIGVARAVLRPAASHRTSGT